MKAPYEGMGSGAQAEHPPSVQAQVTGSFRTMGNTAGHRRSSLLAWAWGQASVEGHRALRGGGGNSWSCVLTPAPPSFGSPPQDSSHGRSTSKGLGGQRGAHQAERREGGQRGNWGALPQERLTTAGQEGACGSGMPGEGALP